MPRSIQCLLAASALGLVAFLAGESPSADKDKTDTGKYPVVEKMSHKSYTEKIPDTKVSFDMVPIPAGKFLMGSSKNEKGRADDEGPEHPVELKGFWVGKFEVTWDEFDAWWRGRPG